MVSLATKSSTQSTIVSKLCSYERKNQTKSALWELDNLIRSIHLLRYIDDITYR
jgi:TnpA family transposase